MFLREPAMHTLTHTLLRPTPATVVLVLRGDAGAAGIDAFDAACAAGLELKPALLVLDLTGVDYMGSMAVGVLVRLRHALLASSAGRVAIAGSGAQLATLLRHLHIERFISLHDSVDAALMCAPSAGRTDRASVA